MLFIEKLRAALKAKGANAWTDDDLDGLFAEDGEVLSAVAADIEEKVGEETQGLAKKNKELLGEKKKLQDQIKANQTADVAELERALEERDKQIEDLNTEHAAKLKELSRTNATLTRDLEKAAKERDGERNGYNSMLIETALTKGLSGVKLNPLHEDLVQEKLRKNIILVDDPETGGRKALARYKDADGKEVQSDVKDYITKVWAATEQGKSLILSKASGGAGGSGAGGSSHSDHGDGGDEGDDPFAGLFKDGSS